MDASGDISFCGRLCDKLIIGSDNALEITSDSIKVGGQLVDVNHAHSLFGYSDVEYTIGEGASDTLTDDQYCKTINVDGELRTSSYALYVNDTLTLNGQIFNSDDSSRISNIEGESSVVLFDVDVESLGNRVIEVRSELKYNLQCLRTGYTLDGEKICGGVDGGVLRIIAKHIIVSEGGSIANHGSGVIIIITKKLEYGGETYTIDNQPANASDLGFIEDDSLVLYFV